jgi:dATP pyrophosphohydrolase
MTEIRAGVVDVFVIRETPDGWRVLALRRAPTVRCPGAWEVVHGSIEVGERPEEAAVRELREETGLACERLYNVTVHAFYLHRAGTIQLAVVFAAFVDASAEAQAGPEHDALEWLTVEQAEARFHWPSARRHLRDVHALLGRGDAGPAEDVLRVR